MLSYDDKKKCSKLFLANSMIFVTWIIFKSSSEWKPLCSLIRFNDKRFLIIILNIIFNFRSAGEKELAGLSYPIIFERIVQQSEWICHLVDSVHMFLSEMLAVHVWKKFCWLFNQNHIFFERWIKYFRKEKFSKSKMFTNCKKIIV